MSNKLQNDSEEFKLLDLKNDYVFKRVFGHSGSEKITKALINSIVETKIESIDLDCKTITEKDLKDDKFGILDIRAKANDGTQINIEMQIVDNKNAIERMLFYWDKIYPMSISEGDNYNKLKPTIVIFIANYNLEKLRKVKDYCTEWQIYGKKYRNINLTNHLQFYILELQKFNESKKCKTDMDFWAKFIKVLKVDKNMGKSENEEALTEAEKLLGRISKDEKEQYLAEQRLFYTLDINTAKEEGKEEGIKEGIKKEKIEIAKYNVPISMDN